VSQDSVISAINALMGDTVKDAFKTPIQTPAGDSAVHHQSLPPQGEPGMGQPSQPPRSQTIKPLELSQTRDEGAVHDALLAQQFLDSNPSQLTIYGLASLHDGLHNNQLAVLFRNNHFNVLLKREGGLYILVTDQGYLYEPDIVWEKLSNVDGDTELLRWDLTPFKPHDHVADESRPGGGATGHVSGDVDVGSVAQTGGAQCHEDADYALALQLQTEEEERARSLEQGENEQPQHHRGGAASIDRARPSEVTPTRPQRGGVLPHDASGQHRRKWFSSNGDCMIM